VRSLKLSPLHPQRGNTVLGVVIGMVVALFIAVAVAIYINKTPVPFVNKARVDQPAGERSGDGQAPDPNRSLYGKDVLAAERKAAATAAQASGNVQVPDAAPAGKAAPEAPPGAASGGAPVLEKSEQAKLAKVDTGPLVVPSIDERVSYFLQAGAFRDTGDADGAKARLAMMGFDAKVAQAEVNGNTVFRVRLGPYARLDDMNRIRSKLAENGVEATVIKMKQP
jgi:cell division protein FtsN